MVVVKTAAEIVFRIRPLPSTARMSLERGPDLGYGSYGVATFTKVDMEL